MSEVYAVWARFVNADRAGVVVVHEQPLAYCLTRELAMQEIARRADPENWYSYPRSSIPAMWIEKGPDLVGLEPAK